MTGPASDHLADEHTPCSYGEAETEGEATTRQANDSTAWTS